MNRTLRLSALALTLAAAGSAFADDITLDTATHASTQSRAQVQQDLAAHRQAGVNPWSTSFNPLLRSVSTLSRSDVARDLALERSRGTLTAMTGEDSGSEHLSRTRAPAPADGGLKLAQRAARR